MLQSYFYGFDWGALVFGGHRTRVRTAAALTAHQAAQALPKISNKTNASQVSPCDTPTGIA